MPVIDTYRPDDRDAVDALYRRVFGTDMAEANRLRWEWQYRRNPNNPATGPLIWLAREGPAVIGQYAAMPVRLSLSGREIDAAWGMDVMVAPERQRQGLGEVLFGTWDQNVGASLGLGLSPSSSRLFKKLRWPEVGPLPCLVKPLTRRALRQPAWSPIVNRVVSAVSFPVIQVIGRPRPLRGETSLTRRFDEQFTQLWERLAPKFDFAVRRDAQYLQWRFISAPHVRYQIVVLMRGGEPAGYAVYRHVHEARGRVTLLVDFLVDPGDRMGLDTLLRWVDREARAADSDKIRAFCMHAGFRRAMKHNGYFQVKSTVEFVAKVNALPVGESFYRDTSRWHVTLGDSDQDR